MDVRAMRARAAAFMMERGWKRLPAKRAGFEQSLFEHSMVELDALWQLLPILERPEHFSLREEEKRVLLAAVLAHDVGKERPAWQAYLRGEGPYVSDVDPELTRQTVPLVCQSLGFEGIAASLVEVCIRLHMRAERGDAGVMGAALAMAKGEGKGERWKTLADIVDAVDNFCSARGVHAALGSLERSILSPHLRLSYHLVTIRGVSTTLLHRAAVDSFAQAGWWPLLYYSDATLYVVSAAEEVAEPSRRAIEERLAALLAQATGKDVSRFMVGSPMANILPKPELFDHREARQYLAVAAGKVGRTRFLRRKVDERRARVGEYLRERGEEPSAPTDAEVDRHSQRMSAAHPEMVVFKFFKAMMSPELVGEEGQEVARELYEGVFGPGSWQELQGTSTLMPARDMARTVDHFWALPGEKFGLPVARVEELADERRTELLVDVLADMAERVYAAIERPPSRAVLAGRMAAAFMADLVRPAEKIDFAELARGQLQAYGVSKPYAGRETKKAQHFCPICNTAFAAGTKASADFLDKPEAHTNRAVSHGPFGYVVICDTCRFERILRQLLLGSKPAEVIVLLPRMNIGYGAGDLLVEAVSRLYERVHAFMLGEDDAEQRVSLGLTQLIARKVWGRDLLSLTPEETAELFVYRAAEDARRRFRRELEKALRAECDGDLETANLEWGTSFETWDEAVEAVVVNRVADEEVRRMRAGVYRLYPQVQLVCQTPNLILVPVVNPISVADESDTNAALRKLFISLILGLVFDSTVAVKPDYAEIDFAGGEGVAFVPPVPAVRSLVGTDWVSLAKAQKWVDAIGAASVLAAYADYPARTDLFQILSAPTPGHILRRIEERPGGGRVGYQHFVYLEAVKEVLR